MLPVTLTVGSAAAPGLTKVVNAASYAEGGISPGEVVTLGGVNLGPSDLAGLAWTRPGAVANQVAGVQVLINGVAAPLIYASATQVAAVAPYDLDGQSSAAVKVTVNGQAIEQLTMPSYRRPGIFTADASGSGGGAILNGDIELEHGGAWRGRGENRRCLYDGRRTDQPGGSKRQGDRHASDSRDCRSRRRSTGSPRRLISGRSAGYRLRRHAGERAGPGERPEREFAARDHCRRDAEPNRSNGVRSVSLHVSDLCCVKRCERIRLLTGMLWRCAPSRRSPLDTLLKGVTRYNKAKTLQVLFKEEYTPPARAAGPRAALLMLRKPGKMRWDYSQPGQVFVSDGKAPLAVHAGREPGREDEIPGDRRYARAARLPSG